MDPRTAHADALDTRHTRTLRGDVFMTMALAKGAFARAGGSTAATAPARVARSRRAVSCLGSQRGGRGAQPARGAFAGALASPPSPLRAWRRASRSPIGSASYLPRATAPAPPRGASFNRGGSASSSSGASPSQLNAASSVGPGESSLYRAYREGAASKSAKRATPPSGSGSWDEDLSASASFDAAALPLKINQDILLWNARCMRKSAMKVRKRDDRVRARLNAMRLYERAKAVDPSDGRAYVGMGQVLKQLGDVDAARRVYQDGADATGGDSAYIWQAWATLEERAGDVAKARQLYDAALAADKTHAAAWRPGRAGEEQGTRRARLLVKGSRLVPASKANPHRPGAAPWRRSAGACRRRASALRGTHGSRRAQCRAGVGHAGDARAGRGRAGAQAVPEEPRRGPGEQVRVPVVGDVRSSVRVRRSRARCCARV